MIAFAIEARPARDHNLMDCLMSSSDRGHSPWPAIPPPAECPCCDDTAILIKYRRSFTRGSLEWHPA